MHARRRRAAVGRARARESSRGVVHVESCGRARSRQARCDADGASRRGDARAQTALDAMGWIESAMEKIDWGKLRREELSSEELCDAAYALGNVVRLWKECAPMIEGLMTSDEAKALRRRDAFLTLLSQAKKLRYPDRSAYGTLDALPAPCRLDRSGEDYFLVAPGGVLGTIYATARRRRPCRVLGVGAKACGGGGIDLAENPDEPAHGQARV